MLSRLNAGSSSVSIDSRIYLFKDGVVNEELTGGFDLLNFINDGTRFVANNAQSGTITTVNPINMSGYKVGIEFETTYTNLNYQVQLQNSTYGLPYWRLLKDKTNPSEKRTIIITNPEDTTAGKLQYSDGVMQSGVNSVYKIWLEKA